MQAQNAKPMPAEGSKLTKQIKTLLNFRNYPVESFAYFAHLRVIVLGQYPCVNHFVD